MHFGMNRATLHLAVSILDRFLANTKMLLEPSMHLQTCALACVMIAGKHEEILPPDLPAYSSLLLPLDTQNPEVCPHSRAQCSVWSKKLCAWELAILDSLGWRLLAPTLLTWVGLELVRREFESGKRRVFDHQHDQLLLDAILDACLLNSTILLHFYPETLCFTIIELITGQLDLHSSTSKQHAKISQLANYFTQNNDTLLCIPNHPYDFRQFFTSHDNDRYKVKTFSPMEAFEANSRLLEFTVHQLCSDA